MLGLLSIPALTQAGITHIEIANTEDYSPGTAYGAVGAYEKLTGAITGEVDPNNPKNAIITDLVLAPVNANGKVEYTADFIMIKPKDMTKANGILRYDAPNRGNMLTYPPDPVLLKRGYVILYGAWQGDVPKSNPSRLTLTVPVAKNADGSPITGLYRSELVPTAPSPQMALPGGVYNGTMMPYEPVSLDNTGASLTRRVKQTDPHIFILNSDWKFARCNTTDNPFPGKPDSKTICLKGGFDPNYLYELVYTAKDPKVMGLGLAAVRDYVTFFHYGEADSVGNPNPVAGRIKHILGQGTSQCGNFMKTFIHLGFNQASDGSRVFNGVYSHVAARQTQVNARFAVPGGGGGLRTDHTAFGQTAPRGLAEDSYDAVSGRVGGVMAWCSATNTCPKFFLGFSGTEFYVLQGSPVFTDAYGLMDVTQPDNTRIYFYSSTQHGGAGGTASITWNPIWTPAATNASIYPAGTVAHHNDTFRALWIALEDWVVRNLAPPPSEHPKVSDGTLVRPDQLVFPVMKGLTWKVAGIDTPIPEFKYLGWYNDWPLLDFGPRFLPQDDSGIADHLPPYYMGKDYGILVPQVDADGLDIAGIRSVDVQAPIGTSLDFNYNANLAWNDLFGLSGSYIPFHKTRAARLVAGDTRLSLEERYGTQKGYVVAVTKAANDLVVRRFLLREDADRIIANAATNPILP